LVGLFRLGRRRLLGRERGLDHRRNAKNNPTPAQTSAAAGSTHTSASKPDAVGSNWVCAPNCCTM
jgi:hypothetical protein